MSQRKQLKATPRYKGIGLDRRYTVLRHVPTLIAILDLQQILDTTLELCTAALVSGDEEDNHLISALLLFSPDVLQKPRLRVRARVRLSPVDLQIELHEARGIIRRVIDDGESRLAHNLSKDPELGRFISLQVCREAYCVPLQAGSNAYGVMIFAHPDENFFTEEYRELLDIIGNHTAVAIQNARHYDNLKQELDRVMKIQELIRRKVARDLHDGPTQSIAALAMRLNFARRMLERDDKAAIDELIKVEELARKTTNEMRRIVTTLQPLTLESHGLSGALEAMAERMRVTYNQNIIMDVDQEVINNLDLSKQVVMFYVAEEAVNNAQIHAKAAHIWVRLKMADNEMVLLEIEDDGVRLVLDVNNITDEYQGSSGLRDICERAKLVNGVLNISPVEERGMRVQLLIPLKDKPYKGLKS